MRAPDIPTGLSGVRPRDPIGVHVNVGVKGKGGAPTQKDRFWLMTPSTHSQEFSAGGKSFRALASDPHPSFGDWTRQCVALGDGALPKGPGRVGSLSGNIVHRRLEDAAFWNRSAQKLPEPHANSPSQRPACEGNGITARRFREVENGEEKYDEIACPNQDCIFAQRGMCKPVAHLIFRLRWKLDDPWEGKFPSLLALWTTRGWNSLRNVLGLFELVLGTEAVAPWLPRNEWKTGLAAEMGISDPSLVGMPFVMTVGEKTKPSEQRRFPVINFSPDGDLVAWLLAQRRDRLELADGGELKALPPASVRDADFIEVARHEARAEIEVLPELIAEAPVMPLAAATPAVAPAPSPKERAGPEFLSAAKVASITRTADQAGVPLQELALECARLCGTGSLAGVPADYESELLRFIREHAKKAKR